jgi:polysaccharide export outer membrane protein
MIRAAAMSVRLSQLTGAILSLALMTLGGCNVLPHDGPTPGAVESGATGLPGSYSLVELDARSSALIASIPPTALLGLGRTSSTAPNDQIGVGDGLIVTIFDHSPDPLFGSSISLDSGSRGAGSSLPKLSVDKLGNISFPYVGAVHVAGLTTVQAAQAIADSLRGKAVHPQVVVNIADNVANSVTVTGEVHVPGRYALAAGSDHILDILALAGGSLRAPGDTRIVVARAGTIASVSLTDLMNDGAQNVRLAPRDQIRLLYAPRKFSTFGALGHPSEIPIEDESVTLAAALSRAGGLDPGSANASAVYLFRFERPQVASALSVNTPTSPKGVPIVYHLNLRDAEELFVANQFEVEPGDLIYVPRAALTELQQFISVVNAASAVAYNIRVTTAIVQ